MGLGPPIGVVRARVEHPYPGTTHTRPLAGRRQETSDRERGGQHGLEELVLDARPPARTSGRAENTTTLPAAIAWRGRRDDDMERFREHAQGALRRPVAATVGRRATGR